MKANPVNNLNKALMTSAVGLAAMTAVAPILRVKLLLQTQNELLNQNRMKTSYRGALDCISRTFKSEGIRSFWRGNLAGCLMYVPSNALIFAFKQSLANTLRCNKSDYYLWSLFKNVISGGAAGFLSLAILYSLDYTRTRLATDVLNSKGKRQFKGIVDVYRKTLSTDGIRGLYRGFFVSCLGIVVYRGVYFGLYDATSNILLKDNSSISQKFALGYGVTVCAGLLSYPLDTIRTRMLMRSCENVKYRNSLDCAATIFRNEGAGSFMKGAATNIVKGIAGATFLVAFNSLNNFKK